MGLLSLLLIVLAFAQNIPKNDGWVTDLGNLLTPQQEQTLEDLMESYRTGTTHEIALLTVESLQGRTIEELGLETAREWGLGSQDSSNGALFVVAVNDRKMRIEVGRGLEGTLTDAISGRIVRDVMRPQFKQGDFFGGIYDGIVAAHAAIGGDYGPVDRARKHSGSGDLARFMTLAGVGMAIFILMRRGGRYRHSRGLGGAMIYGGLGGGGLSSGRGGFSGGGFGGFGGGGGFSGGGSSGGW